MNIFVTGASGFIASQIVTDLMAAGHQVTCCVRDTTYTQRLFPRASVIACDFIQDTSIAHWIPRLKDIDIVINCVGILYHPNKKLIWAIHHDTPRALFDACVKTGVKKIIQISALNIDKTDVDYARSKKAADDYLLSLPIKSIILRPSLVYGRGSYGGTSLFRGLAGLPGFIPVPGKGTQTFQPIHLQALSQAILKLVDMPHTHSMILHAVGPQKITLTEILMTLRTWLGFSKALLLLMPLWLIRLGAWMGNAIPYSSLNTTAYKMLIQHNMTTDEEAKKFHAAIGFIPYDFITGLYRQPSTVQDRWHARLYFLRPLLQFSLAFIWIFSAACSLFFYPHEASLTLLSHIGINAFWAPILLYSASILDAAIGIAILINYQRIKTGILQILLVILYSIIITWKLPHLWLEPFAPIAKNIPLLAAVLIFLALEKDR